MGVPAGRHSRIPRPGHGRGSRVPEAGGAGGRGQTCQISFIVFTAPLVSRVIS